VKSTKTCWWAVYHPGFLSRVSHQFAHRWAQVSSLSLLQDRDDRNLDILCGFMLIVLQREVNKCEGWKGRYTALLRHCFMLIAVGEEQPDHNCPLLDVRSVYCSNHPFAILTCAVDKRRSVRILTTSFLQEHVTGYRQSWFASCSFQGLCFVTD